MSNASDRRPLFERLKASLEDGIRYARGELNLKTVTVATAPPAVSALEIASLRKKLDMSQAVFASIMNVSAKTVQSWEQGERQPSQSALRLLQVMQLKPVVVCRIAGLHTRHQRKDKRESPEARRGRVRLRPKSITGRKEKAKRPAGPPRAHAGRHSKASVAL
jgi:putative transcriptional regulator